MKIKNKYNEHLDTYFNHLLQKHKGKVSFKNNVRRWSKILKKRAKGDSLQSIADELKITRERVRQIEGVLNKKIVAFFNEKNFF